MEALWADSEAPLEGWVERGEGGSRREGGRRKLLTLIQRGASPLICFVVFDLHIRNLSLSFALSKSLVILFICY